jgi:hypothetical protein
MHRYTLTGITLLAMALEGAQAITIEINLGTSSTLSYDRTVAFESFNGTPLLGQNLSVDFTFMDQEFVRLFSVTTAYETSLTLQTDGSGMVGFLDGTGYLVDANGNPLHTPQDLGSAASSDAWICAALYPLWSNELAAPTDSYGVHYDLTLPNNPQVMVTAATLRLQAAGSAGPFGIGPDLPANIVPDSVNTLLLFGMSLTGVIGMTLSRIPGNRARG